MSKIHVDEIFAKFDEKAENLDIWDRNATLFSEVCPIGAFLFLHDCGDSGPGTQVK
jgi:hypothetical protein